MSGRSFADQIVRWRFLLEQSRPLLGEAPHLVADHASFEALVKEVEELRAHAIVSSRAAKEATRRRREAEDRGMEMRDRLAGALIHQFGSRSEKLLDFGMIPKRRSRPKKAKPPEEPETPPSPTVSKAADEPPAQ